MKADSYPQTIAWFREHYRSGTLDLKKPYQRNPVWSRRQKCSLIETILLGLPIPEIFVEVETQPDGKQTFGVVDGQQRIRAILQFVGAETDPEEAADYDSFVLDRLDDDNSDWRNMGFADLTEDDKSRFFETSLAVRLLTQTTEAEVRDMFKRLNKYLTPLNAQELRKATYSGPFIQLAADLADDEYWSENRIVSPAQIRRMKDIEFVSELLIGVMHGPQDGSPKTVDEYYRQYEDYEGEFPGQRDTEEHFHATLETVKSVLPVIGKTRWKNVADLYTLFVALAQLERGHRLPRRETTSFRKTLIAFGDKVDLRLSDDTAKVSKSAAGYVRGVQKRVNAKGQRAVRMKALTSVIEKHFVPGKRAEQ